MSNIKNLYFHVRDLTKIIYSLLSICFVIGALFLTFYWLLSSEYYYHIRPFREQVVVMEGQEAIFNNSLLIVGSGRMQYRQWIVDSNGNTVHEYEPTYLGTSNKTNLTQSYTFIPSTLKRGVYHIHAQIFYQMNPLKTSKLDIDMGSFIVE